MAIGNTLTVRGPASDAHARGDATVTALIVVDLLIWAAGALAHLDVRVPLGVAWWDEPRVIPAAIVETLAAAALAIALAARLAGRPNAERIASYAFWFAFVAVLFGMARLASGAIPEARTESNDYAHIAMTALSTIGLVRLAGLRRETAPAMPQETNR